MYRVRKPLELFSNSELEAIHNATLEVLRDAGFVVRHDEALKLLNDSGAEVDWNKRTVRMPPELIEESVRKAPKHVMLGARERKHDMELEHGKVYFGAFTGTYMLDLHTGDRRLVTSSDVVNFTKLADALSSVHYVSCDEEGLLDTIDNTLKHIELCPLKNSHIQIGIRIVGDEDQFRKRPFFSTLITPTSPLQMDHGNAETLLIAARNRVPLFPESLPMAGATAPATLPGTLVIQNAEELFVITLAQLVNPGTPVVYGSWATIMDQRYGRVSEGAPELSVLSVGAVQLARYYGLPSHVGAGMTDAKVSDAQAGYEKVLTCFPAIMAGTNVVTGLGILDSMETSSYEQLVIDNEIAEMMLIFARGCEVSDETLALDLIKRLGPGGQYLTERHTIKHMYEHYIPKISDRTWWGHWKSTGQSKDAREKAREKAKQILKTHEVKPLERSVREEISQILRRRAN